MSGLWCDIGRRVVSRNDIDRLRAVGPANGSPESVAIEHRRNGQFEGISVLFVTKILAARVVFAEHSEIRVRIVGRARERAEARYPATPAFRMNRRRE